MWVAVYLGSRLTSSAGFDTLLTRDITKSSSMQRAGRAGREVRLECLSRRI